MRLPSLRGETDVAAHRKLKALLLLAAAILLTMYLRRLIVAEEADTGASPRLYSLYTSILLLLVFAVVPAPHAVIVDAR